jgi:hypothetical protein
MMDQQSNSQTNSGASRSQQRLSQPPNIITGKDLAYLKDAMSWELLTMKKCRMYAEFSSDPEIKNQLDGVGQMHQRHYDTLLQYLQSNPNQHYIQ